jgi:luciferase family oxidoreductase group 1
MRLGVLDVQGRLADTIELAPLADRLGYTRYWLTEFPPQPSPIVLAGVIAGLTERIRVGTAAILFNYYPPKRTAHEFQLLERLYDGRIDAGLSSSSAAAALLVDDLEGRDHDALLKAYPERFALFLRHLRNTPASPSYQEDLAWHEAPERPPQVWSLGAGRSASIAAKHGTAYGYALMYQSSVDDPGMVTLYRDGFKAYQPGEEPYVAVAVCGVCAETDDKATAAAQDWGGKIFVPRIVGSPATCVAQLVALRARYHADEIIFADMCEGVQSRIRCYELLAEAAATAPELA